MPSLLGNPTISTKTSLFRQKKSFIKISSSTTTSTATATIDIYTQPQIEMETQTLPEIKPNLYDVSVEAFEESELILSNNTLNSINTINDNYLINLANKKYDNIPNDFNNYMKLYDYINQIRNQSNNINFKVFLTITINSLKGAVEAHSLYSQNKNLTKKIETLNKKIDTFNTQKNITSVTNATGTLAMEKTFTMTPLFSHYIQVYGMPEYGEGFDPEKLSNIMNILNEQNIDPYES